MNATAAKLYILSNETSDCYEEIPASARFHATIDFAELVKKLQAVVKELELYKVEKFYSLPTYFKYSIDPEDENAETVTDEDHPDYDPEEALRIESVTLNVSNDEFWFAANVKHSASEFTTEKCSIEELLEFFSLA